MILELFQMIIVPLERPWDGMNSKQSKSGPKMFHR
jgi:hypothetical protein